MKLPTDVVMSVRDLVNTMQPNTPDAYEQLKARLTASYGKTKWQQVNALLDMPPLGDRRPLHLLNEMLAILPTGENKDGANFLGIFLRKLPTTMRDHLAAANTPPPRPCLPTPMFSGTPGAATPPSAILLKPAQPPLPQ
jgi:hypothetical protein